MQNIDYTNIANGNYKPTKRADMLEQLEKLAEYLPEGIDAGNILNGMAAAFSRHTKRGFVASAVSKDDARLVLNYVYNNATDHETVATDGRRVHVEAGVKYEDDCLLCPKTMKRIDTEMIYPKYKHVMPNPQNYLTFKLADFPIKYDRYHGRLDFTMHAIFGSAPGEELHVYFDKAYLADLGDLDGWLVKIPNDADAWKAPTVFESLSGNKKAVIMPYRKK